jgi:hypothetical protein
LGRSASPAADAKHLKSLAASLQSRGQILSSLRIEPSNNPLPHCREVHRCEVWRLLLQVASGAGVRPHQSITGIDERAGMTDGPEARADSEPVRDIISGIMELGLHET